MNNVSPINKANRLREEEVHAAAEELQESGIKVSSIEVYKFLGRGSLTTITNFLKTWKQENVETTTLPALITLPEALKKSTEQLIVKLWAESQELAEHEINSQREALRQAEAAANERINEAQAFSEEQSKQIEALEAQIEELKKGKSSDHDFFLQEEKRLQKIIEGAKKSEGILETRIFQNEKQLKQAEERIKELEAINQVLIGETASLKAKLETSTENFESSRNELKEKLAALEAENKALEIKNEVQKNQVGQITKELIDQKELTAKEEKDNKALREKAAKLEGELIAWKTIKSEEPAVNQEKPKKSNKAYKQTEWTEATPSAIDQEKS